MKTFYKPSEAISWAKNKLYDHGYIVKTERWQGIPSPSDMWETLNTSFQIFIPSNLEDLKREVKPNLPWADDHFEERVSGFPLNPPPSNEWWPFNNKKNEQFKKDEVFSHTYPERMWPKKAPMDNMGSLNGMSMKGLRYEYGDFSDLLNLLESEPFTRQAFLPIWFPEDTGAVHKERVPCTIGYHFMRRGEHLHVVYYIRSCDYLRHFRDDIYMACRKGIWIIEKLKEMDYESWKDVKPGYLAMHITSLHVFYPEKEILKQNNK